jgi:hypothetical protein
MKNKTPNSPIEQYTSERHRNRRKITRRRQALNVIAQDAGWDGWSTYETAVKNNLVLIAPNPYPRPLDPHRET